MASQKEQKERAPRRFLNEGNRHMIVIRTGFLAAGEYLLLQEVV